VQIEGAATGTGAGAFIVRIVPAGLALGDYSTQLSVKSTDGQSVAVPVTLHVIAVSLAINGDVPTFTAVNGTTIAPGTLAFAFDNGASAAWTMSSDAPWMTVSALGGTTPASVTLQPDPTIGPLASGGHDAHLTLASAGVADKVVTSHLQLVAPTMTTSVQSMTLGGAKGRDIGAAQSLSLAMNTGNAFPWSVSNAPAWLAVTSAQTSVGPVAATVNVASAAGAPLGSDTAALVFQSVVNGDVVTAPVVVNINADQRRLLPSTWGVGFASSPTGTVLSRTLTMRDNFGGSLAWTASSDSGWLSATASGTTGGASTLALAANPASLANGTISVASVTVSTTTPGVSPAVIRVGLWKDATGLASIVKLNSTTVANVVADRIRPLVYTNNAGTGIDVYNAYTATKVGTIANAGASLGPMAVSPDGSRLYAVDTSNRAVDVIDLTTLAKTATWSLDNAVTQATTLVVTRPNGVEVVILADGTAYTGGRSLGRIIGLGAAMAATDDGTTLFNYAKWAIDYTEVGGGVLTATSLASGAGGDHVAVAGDGSAFYTATGYPYRCQSYSTTDLSLIGGLPGGGPYPNNVAVTSDDRAICGISDAISGEDIWVHSAAGALLSSFQFAGSGKTLSAGQMVVTPDGFVVVAPTDDPLLAFVPIGP
jgi:hypothetical protein